jgi:hypothetical protein
MFFKSLRAFATKHLLTLYAVEPLHLISIALVHVFIHYVFLLPNKHSLTVGIMHVCSYRLATPPATTVMTMVTVAASLWLRLPTIPASPRRRCCSRFPRPEAAHQTEAVDCATALPMAPSTARPWCYLSPVSWLQMINAND